MSLKNIKTFFVALALLALFVDPAKSVANDCCYSCCDTPCCWNGIYLTGELGGGWARHHVKFNNANYFNTAILSDEILGNSFNINTNGFVGGGGLGYNYQCGSFVIGVEGGALGMNLKKTNRSPFYPDTDRFTAKVNCLGFAKLRVGYAFDCLLGYVTGGWAGGNVHLKLDDLQANVVATTKKWINGWTVGAGLEYKFCSCWSVGLAYDYMRFEHKQTGSCSSCGTGAGFGSPSLKHDVQLQTLMFRINYYFNL